MQRKCCVPNCETKLEKGNHFFRFPKSKDLRKLWIQNINPNNWTPDPMDIVCSDHFEEKYKAFNIVHTENGGRKFQWSMSKNAIPTIFSVPVTKKNTLKEKMIFDAKIKSLEVEKVLSSHQKIVEESTNDKETLNSEELIPPPPPFEIVNIKEEPNDDCFFEDYLIEESENTDYKNDKNIESNNDKDEEMPFAYYIMEPSKSSDISVIEQDHHYTNNKSGSSWDSASEDELPDEIPKIPDKKTKMKTTKEQYQKLVELLNANKQYAKSKSNVGSDTEGFNTFWLIVTRELNKLGPPKKITIQWKKSWNDYRRFVRNRILKILEIKDPREKREKLALLTELEKDIFKLSDLYINSESSNDIDVNSKTVITKQKTLLPEICKNIPRDTIISKTIPTVIEEKNKNNQSFQKSPIKATILSKIDKPPLLTHSQNLKGYNGEGNSKKIFLTNNMKRKLPIKEDLNSQNQNKICKYLKSIKKHLKRSNKLKQEKVNLYKKYVEHKMVYDQDYLKLYKEKVEIKKRLLQIEEMKSREVENYEL